MAYILYRRKRKTLGYNWSEQLQHLQSTRALTQQKGPRKIKEHKGRGPFLSLSLCHLLQRERYVVRPRENKHVSHRVALYLFFLQLFFLLTCVSSSSSQKTCCKHERKWEGKDFFEIVEICHKRGDGILLDEHCYIRQSTTGSPKVVPPGQSYRNTFPESDVPNIATMRMFVCQVTNQNKQPEYWMWREPRCKLQGSNRFDLEKSTANSITFKCIRNSYFRISGKLCCILMSWRLVDLLISTFLRKEKKRFHYKLESRVGDRSISPHLNPEALQKEVDDIQNYLSTVPRKNVAREKFS